MDDKRRKHRDFVQNMLIAVLSVSAVFLFMQTQIYNLGLENYSHIFSPSAAQKDMIVTEQNTGIVAPVRVAVTGAYGRYASVTMTTGDETFDPLGRILGEVLGSARDDTVCSSQVYLDVLKGTSVYYDFLNPLPLSVLADFTGTDVDHTAHARSLVVAPGEKGVELYVWDGEKTYRRYATAVSKESLESVVNQYEMGNAQFAFDGLDEEGNLPEVSPYALFLEKTPELEVLTEMTPAVDAEEILVKLQFNPNTKSRYTETGGTEVIMENGRSLRLQADGKIVYQSGGEGILKVAETAGETPAMRDIAEGSKQLMDELAGLSGGDGTLYLTGIRQSGNETVLTYGYQVQGIPVCFSDGLEAGTITISEATVSDLSLRLRQYTVQEETSMLLPLRQALAIAERYEGAELFIGYAGDGNGRVKACWLAE